MSLEHAAVIVGWIATMALVLWRIGVAKGEIVTVLNRVVSDVKEDRKDIGQLKIKVARLEGRGNLHVIDGGNGACDD